MKIVLYGDSITDMDRIREPNSGVRSYGFGYPFLLRVNCLQKILIVTI